MLTVYEPDSAAPLGFSRRELLRIGGAGMLRSSPPHLLGRRAAGATEAALGRTLGRAKNIIYLFLSGGPSQYETFDPKPEAPAEIKGTFRPIASSPRISRRRSSTCWGSDTKPGSAIGQIVRIGSRKARRFRGSWVKQWP